MGTSKFTHKAHMACPPKKEKHTYSNVLIIHNLWGLPNLPIGPQSDPKKEKYTYSNEKYANSNVLKKEKYIPRSNNYGDFQIYPLGPSRITPKKGKYTNSNVLIITQFMGTSKFTHWALAE